jgi:microcystin-dependent protein
VPYIGELRIFPWAAIPPGWLACDGALISIDSNQALFSLIGQTYGGDGQTTFGLPDLRGRVPLGAAPRVPTGDRSGEEATTLSTNEMAAHVHAVQAVAGAGTTAEPAGALLAGAPIWGPDQDPTPLATATVVATGGGLPHPNMQPSLALNICIAAQGVFPSPT